MSKSYWVMFLRNEIDTRTSNLELEIDGTRKEMVTTAALEKLGELDPDAGDAYIKWRDLDEETKAAEAQYVATKKKRDRYKRDFFETVGVDYYASSTPIEWLKGEVRQQVNDEIMASTPQGQEITRLKNIRKRVEFEIEMARTDKGMKEAAQNLARLIGFSLDPE